MKDDLEIISKITEELLEQDEGIIAIFTVTKMS